MVVAPWVAFGLGAQDGESAVETVSEGDSRNLSEQPATFQRMEGIWLSLLSGVIGAVVAVMGTFWAQFYLRRRDERQQADRERVATVLDFTARANAMAMWAAYIHAHTSQTRKWGSVPALLLRQLPPVDLKDMATTYITYVTELLRVGGQLVSMEGIAIKSKVDDVAKTTFELAQCHLSPEDNRSELRRAFHPAKPLDKARVARLRKRQLEAATQLELAVLARCSTMKGHEVAKESGFLKDTELIK